MRLGAGKPSYLELHAFGTVRDYTRKIFSKPTLGFVSPDSERLHFRQNFLHKPRKKRKKKRKKNENRPMALRFSFAWQETGTSFILTIRIGS